MKNRLVFDFHLSPMEVNEMSLAEIEYWYLSAAKNAKDRAQ